MNENIKKFIEKAVKDKEFQEKMAACTNPDEAYAIASSIQEGFTKEEFVKAMQELYDLSHECELTDEDLATAAGGLEMTDSDKEFLYSWLKFLGTIGGTAAVAIGVGEAVSALSGAAV